MRNIWAIVVGVVLIGGIGITASKWIGGDEPARSARSTAPVAPAAEKAQVGAVTPMPDGNFGTMKIGADEFVIGKADAPVTIVEYASLTCPHCARFHVDTLPGLKKEFIDTGKVRLVYRDFPLDRNALAAAIVARCAGPARYFGFIDTFYASQSNWARSSNPVDALGKLARLGGMSKKDFDACLKNKAVSDAVLEQRLEGEKTYKVNSTPTLYINGGKYSGGLTLDQIRSVVGAILQKS